MDERSLRLATLCEDSLGRRGLVGEHGLSMPVESQDVRVLLDTAPMTSTAIQTRRREDLRPARV